MNNIFELIQQNIFFFIILLWILSSLFSRSRGNQEEQNKRPVPRQQQGHPQGQRAPQRTERPRQAQTTARQPRTATVGDKPWERVETKVETEADRLRKAEQAREQRERMEQQQLRKDTKVRPSYAKQESVHDTAIGDQIGKSMEVTTEVYSERAKALLDFSRINAESATQGMVWSQIFGMPRAKEPHRSNRYSNFKTKY